MNATDVLKDRCSSYHFLARIYRQEISPQLLHDLAAVEGFGEAEGAGEGERLIGAFIAGLKDRNLEDVQAELAVEYAALFLNAGSHPISPYESVYTSPEHLVMQQARDEVAYEYESEGLERLESFNEPEDHIALELEFMGRLCVKTDENLDRGDRVAALKCLEKQARFLAQHLGVWVPQFCEEIRQAHPGEFYRGVAQLTQELVASDGEVVQALIEELP